VKRPIGPTDQNVRLLRQKDEKFVSWGIGLKNREKVGHECHKATDLHP